MDLIINSNHPLKMNGFEPAYMAHFIQWAKPKSKDDKADQNK